MQVKILMVTALYLMNGRKLIAQIFGIIFILQKGCVFGCNTFGRVRVCVCGHANAYMRPSKKDRESLILWKQLRKLYNINNFIYML